MQGTVNSGLFCTSTMDKLAKIVYNDKSLVYKYKGVAEVPPLEMVDDVLTISKCSMTSVTMNATVNVFINNKKLRLSKEKCCVLHVGKMKGKCNDLKIHGEKMHVVDSTKYLGDIIHRSTKVTTNIGDRRVKAVASFAIIRAILQDIPLGVYRTEIGLELRQALFLNSVLYNCETWHGLKVTDIAEIKLIDNQLLRYICKAQAKTPQEFLFLETGAIPIDFIISSRRISYLYEILNRSDNELLKRVYLAQLDNPSPGDFVNLVETDCKKIGITINQDWVCNTPKYVFQKWLRQKVKEAALKELTSIQASHQKVRNIVYNSLET